MKPLFKWAGGKNKMLKHYLDVMPEQVGSYCEPFFGGGAMFIYVVNRYNPKNICINDINKDIVSIYKSIRDDFEPFKERLDQLEHEYLSKEGPTKQNTYKDEQTNKSHHCERWHYFMEVRRQHAYDYQNWSKAYESATLYFLMLTGFNGVFQINKNTNGRYGTPPGLMKEKTQIYDRSVLYWWHKTLQNVDIRSGDWKEASQNQPKSTFFFFDPPYRESFSDYGNGFSDQQLLGLIDFCDKQENVMLCNRDDSGWFDDNKKNLNHKHIDVTYTAGRRKTTETGFEAKKAKEILLYRIKSA